MQISRCWEIRDLSNITPIIMDNEAIGSFAFYRTAGNRYPGVIKKNKNFG